MLTILSITKYKKETLAVLALVISLTPLLCDGKICTPLSVPDLPSYPSENWQSNDFSYTISGQDSSIFSASSVDLNNFIE